MESSVRRGFLQFLIIASLLVQFARAENEASGSVFFIDSSSRQYFRTGSLKNAAQSESMSIDELGAAVSVLLGFAPQATLSAAGSAKLDEVLLPNPFDRPRAALLLEVKGVEDFHSLLEQSLFRGAVINKVISGSDGAKIQLHEEEVLAVSLDEQFDELNDEIVSNYASFMGGSYVTDVSKPLTGQLSIALENGVTMNLHMSKKADREFVSSLISLVQGIRMAIEMHEDLSQSSQKPAELMNGCFTGIKVLQEEYGSGAVAEKGMTLLLATISKLYSQLQAAYEGQIVGVVLFEKATAGDSSPSLSVSFTSHSFARWLQETNSSTNETDAEVKLVRRTLAWVTGLILLISTFLGIYLLLNMPLTRDTLLYSNVKLD